MEREAARKISFYASFLVYIQKNLCLENGLNSRIFKGSLSDLMKKMQMSIWKEENNGGIKSGCGFVFTEKWHYN